MDSKTITEENVETKGEISALIFANKTRGFHEFTALVERMLDKYLKLNQKP